MSDYEVTEILPHENGRGFRIKYYLISAPTVKRELVFPRDNLDEAIKCIEKRVAYLLQETTDDHKNKVKDLKKKFKDKGVLKEKT